VDVVDGAQAVLRLNLGVAPADVFTALLGVAQSDGDAVPGVRVAGQLVRRIEQGTAAAVEHTGDDEGERRHEVAAAVHLSIPELSSEVRNQRLHGFKLPVLTIDR
jgi:hypothetical protein